MKPGKSDPLILQALCEQGLALHRSGRFDEAAQLYNKVLRRDPRYADALHLLGMIQVHRGEDEAGAALMRRAVRVNPAFQAAHAHLGMALWKLNRPAEALASYDVAVALRPNDAEAHCHRGVVLGELTRHQEALVSQELAIALKPDYAEAHYNRGVQLQHLKQPQEVLTSQNRAIALNPGYAQAYNNRGTALNDLNRLEEALASYDAAIALRPDYTEAYCNRGLVLQRLKRLDESLASYDQAVALEPNSTDAQISRSFALLLAGDFEAGWRAYESRKGKWNTAARRFDQERRWLGETDLDGKRLFVHHEQGLGDAIQFARYVMLLEDRGVDVSVSVQAPLKPLLQPAMPSVAFIGENERPASFDYQCSLMSLPLAFGTTLDSIPPPPRYLAADVDRRAHFGAQLGPKTKPRIGVAWSGNPTHTDDHNRSMMFEELLPLLSEDADWIALQNEVRPSDASAFGGSGVRFFGDALNDFADTAALVDLMDLVISVDTSIAHLGGSMGKQTWILLPFSPEWRWMLDRRDSPWYPTARLFRQPEIAKWSGVIDQVRDELRSVVG
jgi:tetratricopeptide (TPR) repeat protein